MLPQKIRHSEIASEATLGQKQSCSSYMACRVLHQILAKPADIEFPCMRESITVAERQVGWQMVKYYAEDTSEQHQAYSMQDVYRLYRTIAYIFPCIFRKNV